MGFFSRIGSKMAGAYDSGMRIGSKALHSMSRIGHKVTDVGNAVVGAVEGIPVLSTALATPLSVARKVLDGVGKATSFAEKGSRLLGDVDTVVRSGRDAMNKVEKHDAKRRAPMQTSSPAVSGGSLQHHSAVQSIRGQVGRGGR